MQAFLKRNHLQFRLTFEVMGHDYSWEALQGEALVVRRIPTIGKYWQVLRAAQGAARKALLEIVELENDHGETDSDNAKPTGSNVCRPEPGTCEGGLLAEKMAGV